MIDFSKIKNNKTLQVIAILAVPTALVVAYFGYKYIKKKSDEKKEKGKADALTKQHDAEKLACREKYKDINSVDDFIEGVKCVEQPSQFGYDFTIIGKQRKNLEKMGMDKLRKLYELVKIETRQQTPKQQEEFLDLMHEVYPSY